MHYQVIEIAQKSLVGTCLEMSIANDQTFRLWSSFMPRRKEITNALNNELISAQVFPSGFNFSSFDFNATFHKWAAVEVKDHSQILVGLEALIIPDGLYAMFIHYGPAVEGERTMRYIFETWLPTSGYVIDDRPHFMVMGAKYNQFSSDSEEEVWVPIKLI